MRALPDLHQSQSCGICTKHADSKRGFSLIELMVVVAIAAILAAIAVPTYQGFVQKSRRASAMNAISAVVQAQERWRSNRNAYANSLEDLALASTTPDGYYRITLAGVGQPPGFVAGYIVNASTVSGTAQAKDLACATMSATVNQAALLYSGTNNLGANNTECWAK